MLIILQITNFKTLLSVAQTQHSKHIHCACCEICTEQYDKSKNSNNITNKRTPSLNDGRFPTKRFVQRDNGLIRPQTYNMESDAHLPMNTHHQFITNSPILSE